MYLLKLQIAKDTTIRLDDMQVAVDELYQEGQAVPQETQNVLRERNKAKDITYALKFATRAYTRFVVGEDTCKLLITPAKGASGLDLRLHVQRRGPGKVEYTTELGSIAGQGEYIMATWAPGIDDYPDIRQDIGDSKTLQETGAQYRYEPEIRRVLYGVLEEHAIALWPGIWVVMTEDALAAVKARVGRLTGKALWTGSASLKTLRLEDEAGNRAQVLEEISQGVIDRLEALRARLELPAPQVKRLRLEYEQLGDDILRIEALLGDNLSDAVLDAQLEFGMALNDEEARQTAAAV